MESNENPDEKIEGKSKTNKMVVLKLRTDGKAEVASYDSGDDDEIRITLEKGRKISSKDFDAIPKRMEFFFEKGFKP